MPSFNSFITSGIFYADSTYTDGPLGGGNAYVINLTDGNQYDNITQIAFSEVVPSPNDFPPYGAVGGDQAYIRKFRNPSNGDPGFNGPWEPFIYREGVLRAFLDKVNAENDSGWQNASLASGWSNFGSGLSSARYRKRNGVLYLEGVVAGSTGQTGINNPIFTLPSGYRPPGPRVIRATGGTTTGAASAGTAHTHSVNNIGLRLDIAADGKVYVQTGVSVTYVSLDGVSLILS